MKKSTPAWVWFSLIPVVGSLAIVYAGNQVKRSAWVNLGIFITVLGIILSSTHILGFVWIGQMVVAFLLKDDYLEYISRKSQLPTKSLSQELGLLPKATSKIDINSCSQDDLVHGLGLPIVYANEIESAKKEGYLFTHIEELVDIAGIPESYISKLESLVEFHYYERKEADFSWQRCNTYSEEELVICNLEPEVATKIIRERDRAGIYSSFPDLRKRTGLPLKKLTALL